MKDPVAPVIASESVDVPVGPFSGVSAAGGRVIVSGGTSLLTLRTYDREGRLSRELAILDLGRGQPDVLLAPDGRRAFVSTHFHGPRFGLVTVGVEPPRLSEAGRLRLEGAGFTPGGAKPANFPIETAVSGDVLFLAHGRGLALIRIRDPNRPEPLSVFPLGVKAVNVDVLNGLAAVVGSVAKPTLVLVDVSDPTSPLLRRRTPLPDDSQPTWVAVGPTRIVVAGQRGGAP